MTEQNRDGFPQDSVVALFGNTYETQDGNFLIEPKPKDRPMLLSDAGELLRG
ncbi:hypothetical protein [Nonomuraea sp. NPDC050786]|uniref:hypothetical protein n=1 Tax=Nonomuraea sp. NPDC050786 TaxID=3154840 RepID=UPI0033C45ECA